MAYFPNFSETARLGFQTGAQMGEGQNPLGQFVRSMLADWQQRRAMEQEVGLYKAKEEYKQKLEAESPQGRYYSEMAEAVKTNPFVAGQGTGQGYNPLAQFMTDPNLTEEDYILKPTKVSVRGLPQITNVPTPKDTLTNEQDETIRDIAKTLNQIDRLEELAPNVETGYVAGRRFEPQFPFNRLLMGINPKKEDIEFKSTLTQVKASHAKAESGVQRGFKEIEFLKMAMPDPTYNPEGFLNSTQEAKRRTELNLRNTLIAADRQGKRLGLEYRQTMADLIEAYPLEQYPFGIKKSIVGKQTQKDITPEIAKQILKEVGGDKIKAREIARQRGYNF